MWSASDLFSQSAEILLTKVQQLMPEKLCMQTLIEQLDLAAISGGSRWSTPATRRQQ
ncbi:MAG: hypothetical protein JWP89_5215 [Schlesneria sp.]|nr:hypothetical protein [Schlesneria sp.]